MKKLILIVIFLVIIDVLGINYFLYLRKNKKYLEIKILDDNLLYQTNDILLNDIEEFEFKKYFNTTSFYEPRIKYEFIDDKLLILNNQNKYYFDYKINEPKIIEKTIYKEIEKNYDIAESQKIDVNDIYVEDTYFYVNQDHLTFELNTDFNHIKECLKNNINTSVETSIDYTELNSSQIGEYIVRYVSDIKIIEIIVEIK